MQALHRSGFTLLELMVTLAIVAILAGLAYPSYRHAILKSKRAEGSGALLQLMQQQERYYLAHGRYIAFSSASVDPDERRFKWHSGSSAPASAYEISAVPCAGSTLQECVQLTAVAGTAQVNAQHRDPQCGLLSLSSSGARSPAAPECW